MSHRLEPNSRSISWTETRTIHVGYHDCGNSCGTETPEPTLDVLVEFAKTRPHGGYLWPGGHGEGWIPPNWSYDRELGLLCPACTEAKNTALATRRRK